MGFLSTIGGAIGGFFGGPEGAVLGEQAGGWLGDNSSSIGGLLGDAASAYGSSRQAEMSRDFNAVEAQKSRDWQQMMANSQYQRTVQDLNAAGLSPMLAYSKGATSLPSGSTASSGAVASTPDFGGNLQRSAATDLAREQINVAKSQEQLNIASAKSAAAQAAKTALEVEQMPTKFYYDLAHTGSQINSNSATALSSTATAANTDVDTKIKKPKADFNEEHPAYAKWSSPVRDALDTIFKGIGAGVGAMRGSSALPFHSISTKGR